MLEHSTECNWNIIAQHFFLFFLLFPYVSFPYVNFTQRLTENASKWPHLRRFYANVRKSINIWLDARLFIEKYGDVNAALENV